MKEEIFKVKYEKYECVTHHTATPLSYPHPRITNQLTEESLSWIEDVEEKPQRTPNRRNKRLVWIDNESFDSEEKYIENYGNPLARVLKTYVMVVVEKEEHKVSLKLFWGFRERRVGNTWFKISKNVDYVTVNTKTGDVYTGYLHNFQKKRKATKKINKNFFISEPVNSIKMKLRNILSSYITQHFEVSMEAISKFMFEIDGREEFEKLDFEKRLFRFYLNKKEVKYPNNFHLYAKVLLGPKIRKLLKKNDKKLVDAFMKDQNLSGKKLKTALHQCNSLNIKLYESAKNLFGDDWINQEPDFIINLLNSEHGFNRSIPAEFLNVISKEELRRVFRLFKRVYIDGVLDSYTFMDHIRMYTELKLYGEQDLRWMSDENDKSDFREEHLDWTDKIQFYKRGHYNRIYPNRLYDLIEKPIGDYYPVVLNDSHNYNEESSLQSNCVKTYIGRPSSLIISLRKGSPSSEDRATIEYKFSKDGDKIKGHRVQSLGRFNSRLDEHWMVPLFKLDEYVLSFIQDKQFETVKLTKKCANGTFLESESYWDESGTLRWTYKPIDGNHHSIFDWI
jgi:hypothetical protein